METEKTLFILGAGASAEGGVPVMRYFLDAAERLFARDELKHIADDYLKVEAGLMQLRSVFYKSRLDTRNIEVAFNAFETAQLIGRLGDLGIAEIAGLTDSLRKVIAETIILSARRGVPQYLVTFAQLVTALARSEEQTAEVVTFNYDCLLDRALLEAGASVDYGFGVMGTSGAFVRLLKPHGSLNWFPGEGKTQIATPMPETYTDRTTIRASWPGDDPPVIIPPSLRKADHHAKLQDVWGATARALRYAENIIIAGFSLPPTDEFFRYLFALGSIGAASIKRFWVINRSADKVLADRFLSMLGPEVVDRFRLYEMEFGKFCGKLAAGQKRIDWAQLEGFLRDYDRTPNVA
jgi:hypothetical protein